MIKNLMLIDLGILVSTDISFVELVADALHPVEAHCMGMQMMTPQGRKLYTTVSMELADGLKLSFDTDTFDEAEEAIRKFSRGTLRQTNPGNRCHGFWETGTL